MFQGKKVYTTTAGPLFSRSVARPRGHRAKKAMVYTIFLGKQGERVYTIGPEGRVYTIEPQTGKKKKRGVSTVVVYTFFFPVFFKRKRMQQTRANADFTDLFSRVPFFPFCPPFAGHPSSSPFLGIFSPFSPPRKLLSSVQQRAQRRA